MGLFDNLTVAAKDVQAGIQAAQPVTAAVAKAINLLPEGGLKEWLSKDPVEFWKSIFNIFRRKPYTSDQYRLGERFIDQIAGGNVGYREVPDDVVRQAQALFTILFGVRIETDMDLWAIEKGVADYYLRPGPNFMGNSDVPVEAVERAHMLMKNYYPTSSFNRGPWDLSAFERFPLVAPIPGPEFGTLYTGDLPGGGKANNGIIVVPDSLIKQPSEPAAQTKQETGEQTGNNWLLWLAAAGAALLLYEANRR